MGSMITLGIDRMEIEWGKNNFFKNHSSLFLKDDIKDIPYYYVNDDGDELIIKYKEGYSRKLSSIKNRLELLGYTLKNNEKKYNELLNEANYHFDNKVNLTYKEFFKVLKKINIPKVDSAKIAIEYEDNGYDLGEYVRKCVLEEPEIKRKLYSEVDHSEQRYYICDFFENLDPYIILRCLAENPKNQDLELQWRFADVVENDWVPREQIFEGLNKSERILIVTEGSSDSYIIERAINEIYPDIADFFYFVDMEKNYPFTGAGNLYNFCKGLAKIGVQNNIIALFDNDTAGMEKYELSKQLNNANFLIMKLPNLNEFNEFRTIGPSGESIDNINEKAVAIECFLDLKDDEKVRWTSYNDNLKQYQGELVNKDDFVRVFKKANILDGTYDSRKLKILIEYIISTWNNRYD